MKARKHGTKYRISYRCPGFKKPISETFDTEAEANLRIAQVELERLQGTLLPPAKDFDPDRNLATFRQTCTVAELLEIHVRDYGMTHWSDGTLSENLQHIQQHINPHIGDVPIRSLTTHQLEIYYRKLLRTPATTRTGGEASHCISILVVEKVHALIRSALNQAIRWNYLQGPNPAMAVSLPRRKHKQRDAWSDEEAAQALRLCDDPVLRLCMMMALGCSMRIGEILGMTWDCVHFSENPMSGDEAFLVVEKELKRCSKSAVQKLTDNGWDDILFTFPLMKNIEATTMLVLKTPKTESSVRKIYLPGTVENALKEMKAHQKQAQKDLAGEYMDFNLVISQENGRPYEADQIRDKFYHLIETHHLRRVVFHSLRHSSTSIKLKLSGGDIKAVQGDTGHAQSSMVTDVYSHVMDADRKHLAQSMDKHFLSFATQPNLTKNLDDIAPNSPEQRVIRMLRDSPEMADMLLKMAEMLSGKAT